MYPITHAWFLRELWGDPSDEALLGALFPDTIIVTGLDWAATHKPGVEALAALAGETPATKALALGWLSHGANPHGIDYYGDECFPGTKRGYCFELAEPFQQRAARICGVTDDLGWWKAHNFVEMGIEIHAARRWPQAPTRCATLLRRADEYRGTLSALQPFVGGDVERIVDGFRRFAEYLEFTDLTPRGLAGSYETQARAKHAVGGIVLDDAAALIGECAELVADSLDEFIVYAAREVRAVAETLG